MRSLVTGASGFVGSALQKHLLECGDEVVSLSRSSGGPDITNRDAVRDAIDSAQPEIVFHLAAQAHVPTSWKDPIGTLRANVEGTQNTLDACYATGVDRVLVVSSAEVYGKVDPGDLPIQEETPMRPTNPYAASKVAADAIAVQAHLGRGQDVVRLRSFNHIGPGQSPAYVCAGLAHRIVAAEREARSTIVVGSLEARRDFSDVRDVVAAYRRVAVDGRAGAAYNVCSGVDRSIQELADGLIALSGHDVRFEVSDDLVRPIDTPVVQGDNSRIHEHTGWEPSIPLERSLVDILADARAGAAP